MEHGPCTFHQVSSNIPCLFSTEVIIIIQLLFSYSTEVYFYSYFSGWGISDQLKWLQTDLNEAVKNRVQRPWIIAYGHRPMYCSNLDRDDCTTPKSVVRARFVLLVVDSMLLHPPPS